MQVCAIAAVVLLCKPSEPDIYAEAEQLLADGETAKATIAFGKLGDYSDTRERSFALWEKVAPRETISAGTRHTAGVKTDGTVLAAGWNVGGDCDVSQWTDIVAVSAVDVHTAGLKADGTVVMAGYGDYCRIDAYEWTDIRLPN